MMLVAVTVIWAAVAVSCLARPADEHHTGCNHPSDKVFLKCFMDSGNTIFKALSTGDKHMGLPVLDPMEVQRMDVLNKGEHNHLEIMNSIHKGLGDTVIDKVEADPEHFTFKLNLTNPEYKVKGKYTMDTKIAMLPLMGEGDIEFTLVNTTMLWDITGKPVEKNGKHYMEIKEFKVHLKPKMVKLYIGNLFNGNKELGENVNRFLNENWKEVFDQIQPALEKSFSQLINAVGSRLLERSSYEEMFPDVHV